MKKLFFVITYFVATVSLIGCNNTKSVESLSASSSVTTYNVGDVINKKDIIVEATYSNQYKQNIVTWQCDDFNEDNLNMYTFTASDASKKEKTFNINYLDKNVSYTVKVSAPMRVTKSEWLDEYEKIKTKFEAETLEYTIMNIESIIVNTTGYAPKNFTCSYSSDPRKFIITSSVFKGGSCDASTYMTRDALSAILPADETEGAFYEIYDNYINYIYEKADKSYEKLTYTKTGYLINYRIGTDASAFVKINYKGELQPKTITKAEWIAKYQTFSVKFINSYSTKRYTKANPITLSGYAGDQSSKLYEAKVYNFYPYSYGVASTYYPYFSCNVKVNEQIVSLPLGGSLFDYRLIDNYFLTKRESVYYMEYHFDEVNQKAQIMAYSKNTFALTENYIFNSNGYIEKYYVYGNYDINVNYNGDPIEKIEYYSAYDSITTDPTTKEILDGGYAYISSEGSLTLKKGTTYRFSLVNHFIDDSSGSTPVYGHFGVKELKFTGSSLTDLASVAENFKVFLNNKEIECNVSGTEIIINSGEITAIDSDIVFELTIKSDNNLTLSGLSTVGNYYKGN